MNKPLSRIGADDILTTAAVFIGLAAPATALAYVGPGLGAGTLAVVLGVIASILLALIALVWYPIKRLINKLKPPAQARARKEADPKGP
jgi:hypothetical protein